MANVIGGGYKVHMMKYRGVSIVDGKPQLSISSEGKCQSACSGRSKNQKNAVDFASHKKEDPSSVCKKCATKFDALVKESKKLKEVA